MPKQNNNNSAAQQQQRKLEEPTPLRRKCLNIFFTTVAALLVILFVIGAAQGPGPVSDEDYEASGGADADAHIGIFAIPATCTPDEFVSRANMLVGNFTSDVRSTQRFGGSLNAWMDMMMRTLELKQKKGLIRARMLSVHMSEKIVETKKKKKATKKKKKNSDSSTNTIRGEEDEDNEEAENNDNTDEEIKYDESAKLFMEKEEMERRMKECNEEEAKLDREPRYADLEDDDEHRVHHLSLTLIRWAKGVKSFQASAEKFCDVDGMMDKFVVLANRNSMKSNGRNKNEEQGATVEDSSAAAAAAVGMTVRDFIDREFLPALYQSAVHLLRFAFSYNDAENPVMLEFARSASLHHMETIATQMQPFRDVMLRVLMSLSDVAFVFERDDYQMAFVTQLVKVTDEIVASQLAAVSSSSPSYTSSPSSSSSDKQPQQTAEATTPSSRFFTPSCTARNLHNASQIFCSRYFGTKLVNAKGGADYSVPIPVHEQGPEHFAYLFALLRTTFLEEMIALRAQSMPELRVAYAMSLLELQRYESAVKAMASARSRLEQNILYVKEKQQEASSSSSSSSSSSRDNDDDDNSENSAALLADRLRVDGERFSFALTVVNYGAACFTEQAMLRHVSLLQQKTGHLLKVQSRWTELLLKVKECGGEELFAADGGKRMQMTKSGRVLSLSSSSSSSSLLQQTIGAATEIRFPLPGRGNDFAVSSKEAGNAPAETAEQLLQLLGSQY